MPSRVTVPFFKYSYLRITDDRIHTLADLHLNFQFKNQERDFTRKACFRELDILFLENPIEHDFKFRFIDPHIFLTVDQD